jgi:hypothetical protein
MKTLDGLSLALLISLGCAPVTTITPLSSHSYPTKPQGCDIQILTQGPTNRKYEELAILSTVTSGAAMAKDLNAMLPSIKAAACALGADAVLIKNVEPGSLGSQNATGKAYTVAIKYLD